MTTMNDIQYIYQMLNKKSAPKIQEEGFALANTIDDLSLLIMPPAPPSVWESCAQILFEKPDEVLEPYLDRLLEWLQDLNWPGAAVILSRLKTVSGGKLKRLIVDRVTDANNLKNEEGMMWLDNLSELLDNTELKELLPTAIVETLQKHYKNTGFWRND